jgi:hypothetical protein
VFHSKKSSLKVVRLLALVPDLDPAHKALRAVRATYVGSMREREAKWNFYEFRMIDVPFWNRRIFVNSSKQKLSALVLEVNFAIDSANKLR